MPSSKEKRSFGRPIVTITVAAGANVVIDTNNSYRKGEVGFLAVKGHTTAAVDNEYLFTFEAQKGLAKSQITFPIGIGDAWSINETGYAFLGANNVVGRVEKGKYFHIFVPLLFAS